MGLRAQNRRKRLAALASAKARDGFEAVWSLKPIPGAANSGQFSPPAPCKPDGLLRISRKKLISEFSRVKVTLDYEYSPEVSAEKQSSIHEFACPMNSFLKGLDPTATGQYLRLVSRSVYDPGSLVADFDDVSTDVFFIETGAVRVMVRNAGGREVILGDLAAGEIVGDMAAIDNMPRSANITALHRTTIARMPGPAFARLVVEVPEAAARMLRILTTRVRVGNQRLLEMATLALKYRLYAELLREARPRPGHATELIISPPPLQHVLAARIGGRREAVSREISALLRKGVLRRTSAALTLVQPDLLAREVQAQLRE